MALSFTPKSENDLAKTQLLVAGIYDFQILTAYDKTSKSGNQMIEVKLGIYTGDHVTHHVFDYLLPSMEAKLRHFCDSVGLLAKYEEGNLAASDCKGRSGKCKIVITEDAGYQPKNTVKDYVCRKSKSLGQPVERDDIPF